MSSSFVHRNCKCELIHVAEHYNNCFLSFLHLDTEEERGGIISERGGGRGEVENYVCHQYTFAMKTPLVNKIGSYGKLYLFLLYLAPKLDLIVCLFRYA